MKTVDLSLSPRPNVRYAVLDGEAETGFLIFRTYAGGSAVWRIYHELGDHAAEMIGRDIPLDHDDLGEAFELLEAYLRIARTSDVTKMSFQPAQAGASPRRGVALVG